MERTGQRKKFGGLIAAGRLMNIAQNGKRMERENGRVNCSGAPYEHARVRNIAHGWKEMGSEHIRRANCSGAPYEYCPEREANGERMGGLIAAGRSMNMHVCGILPTAGKKWAAKRIGGLIAAGRPEYCPEREANGERTWAG